MIMTMKYINIKYLYCGLGVV